MLPKKLISILCFLLFLLFSLQISVASVNDYSDTQALINKSTCIGKTKFQCESFSEVDAK